MKRVDEDGSYGIGKCCGGLAHQARSILGTSHRNGAKGGIAFQIKIKAGISNEHAY